MVVVLLMNHAEHENYLDRIYKIFYKIDKNVHQPNNDFHLVNPVPNLVNPVLHSSVRFVLSAFFFLTTFRIQRIKECADDRFGCGLCFLMIRPPARGDFFSGLRRIRDG